MGKIIHRRRSRPCIRQLGRAGQQIVTQPRSVTIEYAVILSRSSLQQLSHNTANLPVRSGVSVRPTGCPRANEAYDDDMHGHCAVLATPESAALQDSPAADCTTRPRPLSTHAI